MIADGPEQTPLCIIAYKHCLVHPIEYWVDADEGILGIPDASGNHIDASHSGRCDGDVITLILGNGNRRVSVKNDDGKIAIEVFALLAVPIEKV